MLVAATNASNVTFKKRIGTTPHCATHGEKKNLSKLRTFGCKAVLYLEPVRRDGPGRFADRGVEGINLALAINQKIQNISAYKIFLIKERVIKVTNQVTFDEDYFPMKAAAISKSAQVAEDPITTEDAFPPEDGRYMVSFDLHLLQPGFKLEKSDRNDAGELVYHCIPHDFPRCTVIASREQYYQVISAMAEKARKDTEQQLSSLEQVHSAQATSLQP